MFVDVFVYKLVYRSLMGGPVCGIGRDMPQGKITTFEFA